MDSVRRKILKCTYAASLVTVAESVVLFRPGVVYAADRKRVLFENQKLIEVLSGVSDETGAIVPSREIDLRVPEIAERHTHVPVEVTSNIAGTSRIILICEQHDFPLIADFKLLNGAQGYIATRFNILWDRTRNPCGVKVNVLAIVQANGVAYSARKQVIDRVSDCGVGG